MAMLVITTGYQFSYHVYICLPWIADFSTENSTGAAVRKSPLVLLNRANDNVGGSQDSEQELLIDRKQSRALIWWLYHFMSSYNISSYII
jgi:hypothetical protein